MKYRSEIDGLRALAVMPVILFHAGFDWFSGGFVGVDVFFVISGYLITTILIEDIENERFSILKFYERRARRILPALFFIVSITYLVSWQFLNPFDLKEVAQSIFAVSIFSSNIYFYFKTGYFDTSAELKPLLHTWSLAVEEQYYLLFPIFLILAWRFGRSRVFWMIFVMSVISLLLSEWGWRNQPNANFYLPHTRVWELFAGSLAAFIVKKRGLQNNNVLALIGLAAIVFSVFFYDESTPFPSVYALVPVLGAVLIILFANENTLVAKFLSVKVLVGLGLISYSLYLWHQPVFALTRQYLVADFSQSLGIFLIVGTIFVSYLTWRFIENPVRRFKSKNVNSEKILFLSASVLLLFGAIGLMGNFAGGYPDRNSDLQRLAQNYGLSAHCSGADISDIKCKSKVNPEIVLWGDSHAMHLGKALNKAFPNMGLHQLTLSSCPPVPGYQQAKRKALVTCENYNSQVFEYLTRDLSPQVKIVVLSSSKSIANPELKKSVRRAVTKMQEKGLTVILVSSTPRFEGSEQCITLALRGEGDIGDCSFLLSEASNLGDFKSLEELANSLDIQFINLTNFMCFEDLCKMEMNEKLVLRDVGHLTNEIQDELSLFLKKKIDF